MPIGGKESTKCSSPLSLELSEGLRWADRGGSCIL